MTRNQVLALFDGGLPPTPRMNSKSEVKRLWYERNKERILAVNRAYRLANKGLINAKRRKDCSFNTISKTSKQK